MSDDTRIERRLPVILADLGAGPAPGYTEALLARTAATRQRPGWTFPERWFPMSAITERMSAGPRVPWRMVALIALLILTVVAAAVVVGSQPRRLPEPFGPAGNGAIAYADAAGDIFVGDPIAGTSKAIATGSAKDSLPVFSPDGTKIAFLRDAVTSGADIVVVDADGSHERVITTEPLLGIGYFAWSPDSRSIAVGIPPAKLLTLDVTTDSTPRVLAEGLPYESRPFNSQVSQVFRPPAGDQILRLFYVGGFTLSVADVDGGNEKVLVAPSRSDIEYTDLASPVWSPDGSMIAFTAQVGPGNDWRVYVMNADGTSLRQLRQGTLDSMACAAPCAIVSEANPAWSPDGSQVAIQRSFNTETGQLLSTRPITVVDVETGVGREIGAAYSPDGFQGWSWSPDGRSIVMLERRGTRPIAVDVATGQTTELPWVSDSAPSWQRVADH